MSTIYLIRKGYNALMRTLENNNCGLEEEEDEDMDLDDMDVDNGEEVVDENNVESKIDRRVSLVVHSGRTLKRSEV